MDRSSELNHGKRLASLQRTLPPFVGRRQQLDWLERCLQDASTGQPRVVLIAGEAGIGKTRLLKEVQSAALHRGVQICYGRCYEDLTLPYLPFVESLLGQLARLPEDMARTLGTDAEVIHRFLRSQQATLPVASPAMSGQAEQDKLRLLVAVARVTVMLAQRCTTLLVIDDLHWADAASLDLFGHLVFTAADTAMREPVPLLILGTYRPEALEARLAHLLGRLQREEICQTLELPGLDEVEMRQLIQGLGLVRPSQQLVTTISAATRGNPLFIQEVILHMQQRGALRERGGYTVTTAAAADLQLPEHVMSALVARTQGLSEGCRRLLTLAAFLGDHFSLPVLSAVSGGRDEEVLDVLDEGIHQRLLLSEAQAFRFAHPLIRQAFYNAPNAVRRQRLHYQIAQALESLYADNVGAHVLEIAHHLVRAGSAAEADKVVPYARRAGDQAFTVFAWDEAARYYEAALTVAESTDRLSTHDRAELHYWAGLSYYRDTDVGPCLDHYEKAIEAYRLTGNVRGLAQALMEKARTHNTFASVPYGTLVDVQSLDEMLEALGDTDPGLQGEVAAVLAEAYRTAKQTDKAMQMARRALGSGQHLKDDRLCAYASFTLGLTQAQALRMRETLQSYQDSLVYARRADDLWLQGWPMQRMTPVLVTLGQLDEAEAVALEACALSRKTYDWAGYSIALSALASVAVARGDFAATARHVQETMTMVSRSRYPWGGARALYALACACTLRGAWTEAEEALDMLIEPGRVFQAAGAVIQTFVGVLRQLLRAHSGVLDGVTEQLAADLIQVGGIDSYALAPLCGLVELSDFMAAPPMAEAASQVLSAAVEQGVLFSNGWVFLLPRALGVADTLNCLWDKAEAHFQAAIEVAARVGARPELGRSYLDYARMLVARGGGNDRFRAIELVSQAGTIFRELGMEPFTRRAAQLTEAMQMRPRLGVWPRNAQLDNLGIQEVEALVQVARSRTNFLG